MVARFALVFSFSTSVNDSPCGTSWGGCFFGWTRWFRFRIVRLGWIGSILGGYADLGQIDGWVLEKTDVLSPLVAILESTLLLHRV